MEKRRSHIALRRRTYMYGNVARNEWPFSRILFPVPKRIELNSFHNTLHPKVGLLH